MRICSSCFAAVVLAAAAVLSSPAAAQQPSGQPQAASSCACPRELNPVCGVDGAFFPNKCLAKCVGIKISDKKPKDGRCGYFVNQAKQQQQPNPKQQQGSKQQQGKQQQKKQQQGKQQEKASPQQAPSRAQFTNNCGCPQDVTIVCGRADSKPQNYQNACYARCFNAQVLYSGPCKAGGGNTNGNSHPAAAAGTGPAVALGTQSGPASTYGPGPAQPLPQAQGVMMPIGDEQYIQPDPQASGLSGLSGLQGPEGQLAMPAGAYVPLGPQSSFRQEQCRCSQIWLPVCALDPQGQYATVTNRCISNCWGASVHCHKAGWVGPCLAHLGRCHSHEIQRAPGYGH